MVEVAIRLFAENGYANTTIDRIVQDAGFGKGTFYCYFKDKDDLLDKAMERHFMGLRDHLHSAIDLRQGFREIIRNVMNAYFRVFRDTKDLCAVMEDRKARLPEEVFRRFVSICRPEFERLKEAIRKAVSEKTLRDLDPEVMLFGLMGSVNFFIFREMKLGIKATKGELDTLLEIFLHGVENE